LSPTVAARNLLDRIKSRKVTNCTVAAAHRSTTATLLGKIGLGRGRYRIWDAKSQRVVNDEEANHYLSCGYRAPWKLA
jgi:hypothetical protein